MTEAHNMIPDGDLTLTLSSLLGSSLGNRNQRQTAASTKRCLEEPACQVSSKLYETTKEIKALLN